MVDPAPLTGGPVSLVLVRHGETTWIREGRFQGRADPPLSETGLRQAARVGDRLADPGAAPALPIPPGAPGIVLSSPLRRAAVVADGIAAGYGVRPEHDPDLAEIDQGAWEGLTTAEVVSRYGPELAAWRRTPAAAHAPGGEPLVTAAERAGRSAGRLLARITPPAAAPGDPAAIPGSHVLGYGRPGTDGEPWPWAVVVAHDGILRLLLLGLLGLPIERYWTVPFGLCAITVLEARHGIVRLRAHNLADHLDGLGDGADGRPPAR